METKQEKQERKDELVAEKLQEKEIKKQEKIEASRPKFVQIHGYKCTKCGQVVNTEDEPGSCANCNSRIGFAPEKQK